MYTKLDAKLERPGSAAGRGRLAELRELIGAGDQLGLFTLPFATAGIVANVRWPRLFELGFGEVGLMVGFFLLAIGVPIWLVAVVQILRFVPRGELITGGAFALVLHPIYSAVALLVLPGLGLVFDSWLGFAVGAALYVAQRLFAPAEERTLAARFPVTYPEYRRRVLLPWL